MKRAFRGILYGLACVVALLGLLVLFINLYLQSPGVQAKIQESLGQAFDLPIEIHTISYTPPSGLKLSGITVPSKAPEAPPFLRSTSVTVRFRLSPLFRNRFIINEVVIHDPTMYWTQTARGKWQPPQETGGEQEPVVEPTPTPEPESPALAALEEPPLDLPPPETDPAKTPNQNQWRGPRFEVQVKHFGVKNGTFDLRKDDDDPVVTFMGIGIEGDISSKGVATGTAGSLKTRIVEKVLLEKLTTQFKLSSDELELRELYAVLGGGKLMGSFDFVLSKDDSPYKLTAEFSDVALRRLLEEGGGPASKVSGTLSGFLKLNGSTRDPSRTEGIGQLILKNGSFKQYGILQFIGDNLQISELGKLELEQAQANFHVDEGLTFVNDLTLKSPNLEIRANGKIKRDGQLKLKARLIINDRISRQLPSFIEENFTEIEGTKQRFVDFEIGGTIDEPETDLVRLVLWKKQKETAIQFFRQIFGGKE